MKAKWKVVYEELGAGIECTHCKKRINDTDVVFGNLDISHCPKCNSEMEPISDEDEEALKNSVENGGPL